MSDSGVSDSAATTTRSRSRRRFLHGFGIAAAAAAAGAIGWKEVSEETAPGQSPAATGQVTGDVRLYGATGDGTTDDTAAFEAALDSSPRVYVPPGDYVISRALRIPETVHLSGGGKYNTRLLHAHDGDFATLAARSTLAELTIDGQGDRYTGRGLVLTGPDGQQSLQAVAVVGFDGYCIDFETLDAGSQFRATQLDVARTDAGTGTGRYAIRVASGQQLSAIPRSFLQVESQGQCAIDFGGCNDFYVVASTLGDLAFTSESRGVHITGSRLLNQQELTVDGHAVTIVGCDISAELTIAPGADHIVLAPNAFNRLPVINRSGNNRVQLPPPYSG